MSFVTFWNEFDDRFNPGFVLLGDDGNAILDNDGNPKRRISEGIFNSIRRVFQLEGIFIRNYNRISDKLDTEGFGRESTDLNIEDDLKSLTNEQLKIISRYFSIDNDNNLRDAFEYFGQGSIYDSEHDSQRSMIDSRTGKLVRYRIHMADGAGVYGRWHSFIRASILFKIEEEIWLKLDRLLACAYIIHYTVSPIQSDQFPGGDAIENIPSKQKSSWREENIELLKSWREYVSKSNLDELDKILGRSFYNQSPFD
jgi:hypothetical protein